MNADQSQKFTNLNFVRSQFSSLFHVRNPLKCACAQHTWELPHFAMVYIFLFNHWSKSYSPWLFAVMCDTKLSPKDEIKAQKY